MPPGNGLIKPVSAVLPKPKPLAVNPFVGLGVEGSALPGQPAPYSPNPLPPLPSAPTPAQAAAPIDFSTLVGTDPQYIRDQANAKAQNDLAVASLLKSFATTRQGYQDNANAHGALFSGAAVHAQNYAGQQYADQGAQQAANYKQTYDNNLSAGWQRILAQYAQAAGGS